MTPSPVEVTVVIPFDWVSGVLVPVAAVLLSVGIAVWLARRERRAADEDRVAAAAARVVRSLTDLAHACTTGDWARVKAAQNVFEGDLNEFSVALDQRDTDVPKYVYGVIDLAFRSHDLEVAFNTSLFLAACVESWVRRRVITRDFTANMPPGADAIWLTSVRLSDWTLKTAPPLETTRSAASAVPAKPAGPVVPDAAGHDGVEQIGTEVAASDP